MKASKIASLTASSLLLGIAVACGTDPVPPALNPPAIAEPTGSTQTSEAVPPRVPPAKPPGAALFSDTTPLLDEAELAPEANQAPTILSVEIAPSEAIRTNDDITAIPHAEDPDGDPIAYRYRWSVNGRSIAADGPTLAATHFDRRDRIGLTVEADDGKEGSFPFSLDPLVVENSAPRITSSPGPLEPDGTFRYEVSVEDADADRGFRFALEEHPEGMRIDEVAGAILWTPRPDQAGVHTVTIAVDDRHEGLANQSFDLTIEFQPLATPAAAAP